MTEHVDITPGPYWYRGMLGVVLDGEVDWDGYVRFLNNVYGSWVKPSELTPCEEWPGWWPFKDQPIPHAQSVQPILMQTEDHPKSFKPAPGPKFDTRELAADGWQLITLGQAKELYWHIALWSPWLQQLEPAHASTNTPDLQPGVLVIARPPKDHK